MGAAGNKASMGFDSFKSPKNIKGNAKNNMITPIKGTNGASTFAKRLQTTGKKNQKSAGVNDTSF